MKTRNLFINGSPRYVRCYDNGGTTLDRYTIVFTRLKRFYPYVASSAMPFNPLGFYQHGEGNDGPIDRPGYKHLGKPVKFMDLPGDVQAAVRSDYRTYWNISQSEEIKMIINS